MRILRSLSAVLVAAVVMGTASACQVALRADGEDARCEPEGSVCAPGLTCQGGFCRPCDPSPEVCDGRDNDCNGLVDEGFDKDGDGYSTCGEASEIDCNDDPARGGKEVHPGAKELCNGYDDDCNGRTDEEPNDCTEKGEECWSAKGVCTIKGDCRIHGCTSGGCNPSTGQCTDPDCRISKSCAPSETCDPKSGICVHLTEVGEPCNSQSACQPGSSCMDISALGVSARSPSICTMSCCESSGCPAGFVCRAGSTLGSVCVKAGDLGLDVGVGAPNAKCSSGSECRSGVCDSICVDSCCGAVGCGAGGTCSYKSDKKFLCRSAIGSKSTGSTCSYDSDCQSGYCYGSGGLFGGLCTKHCCSSEDCDSFSRCQAFSEGASLYSICIPLGFGESKGGRRAGEACSGNGDCRSARCSDGICLDFCCRDSDCTAGSLCKPRKLSGGGYALYCSKPGT